MTYVDPRRVEAARCYAAADKSDPFTLQRAMLHLGNGIAGFRKTQESFNHQGPITPNQDAYYSADEAQEQRVTADGKPYMATVYRNLVRP